MFFDCDPDADCRQNGSVRIKARPETDVRCEAVETETELGALFVFLEEMDGTTVGLGGDDHGDDGQERQKQGEIRPPAILFVGDDEREGDEDKEPETEAVSLVKMARAMVTPSRMECDGRAPGRDR